MTTGVDSDADATDRIRQRITSALEPLLRVDSRQYDRLFTLVLTAFVVTLMAMTFQYNEQTRLMPFVVGIPTLLLLLGLLLVQFSSRFAETIDRMTAGDVLGMDERVQEMQTLTDDTSGATVESTDAVESKMEVLAMSFWVLLLFGLVLTIGFTAGTAAFLVVFYRLRTDLSWPLTLGYTAVIWGFIVVIFLYVLSTPLYPGLFGIEIPFLG